MMGKKMQEIIDKAVREAISANARKAGLKGGAARKEALTAKRRSAIARKASRARWDRVLREKAEQS